MSIKETVLHFGKNRSLVGILTEAAEILEDRYPPMFFINAGLVHKVGPNRLYVNIARALAQKGIASFRFDYSGLGDSPLVSYEDECNRKHVEISQALDAVGSRTGADEFILVGLCTGASDAFFTAIHNDRISGLLLVDGVFQDRRELKNVNFGKSVAIRYYKKHIFSWKRWQKVIAGKSRLLTKSNFLAVLDLVISKVKKFNARKGTPTAHTSPKESEFGIQDWKVLIQRGVKLHCIFCEGDNALDIFNLTVGKKLMPYRRNGQLKFQILMNVDHTFTPAWSQERLIKIIIDWMQEFQYTQDRFENAQSSNHH